MIHSLQLPHRFDPDRLKVDLAGISPSEWVPHYNERDYGGEWHGVALRSISGKSSHLVAGHDRSRGYVDTELLERSPYFREVLATFACPLKAVRLLRLKAGSVIREHSDHALAFEDGEVRIHVPIQTNPGVQFSLSGQALQFVEGGCYYVNVSLPHRVENRGTEDRIHLVIDADVNEWLSELFASSEPVAASPSIAHGVEAFRVAMRNDPVLQQRLHAADDWTQFSRIAAEAASELNIRIGEADIDAWRFRPRDESVHPNPPVGAWMPVNVVFEPGGAVADWVYFGQRRFCEPYLQ